MLKREAVLEQINKIKYGQANSLSAVDIGGSFSRFFAFLSFFFFFFLCAEAGARAGSGCSRAKLSCVLANIHTQSQTL